MSRGCSNQGRGVPALPERVTREMASFEHEAKPESQYHCWRGQAGDGRGTFRLPTVLAANVEDTREHSVEGTRVGRYRSLRIEPHQAEQHCAGPSEEGGRMGVSSDEAVGFTL